MAPHIAESIVEPLKIEASSAPEGGILEVRYDEEAGSLVLVMSSDDLSTLRAMLNSYMGLVSAAIKTASDRMNTL